MKILIFILIIQTGMIKSNSLIKRYESISFINYSSISLEKETEICREICIECFYDSEHTDKVSVN